MGLWSLRFATVDDIKENAEVGLRAIKKDDFKECFKAWEDRWSKCCVQKEGTLKVIRLVSPTVHSIKFYSKILGTF
jgi:hypothetical protein